MLDMLDKRRQGLWIDLQGKKPHMPHFLSEVQIDGLRGIHDLRVPLDYPVSVIAGENASGKSTVLFAAACAYKVPEAMPKDYVPSTFFPDYSPTHGVRRDEEGTVKIGYTYSTPGGSLSMQWGRYESGRRWNRSFFGRKQAKQPERPLYVRTLSNLSNPSEVRSVLQLSSMQQVSEEPMNAVQIDFAQRILTSFTYSEVVKLLKPSDKSKTLLFASRNDGAAYSEFHMAAGERALLHMAHGVSQLKDALVLIDEVEAGLHPWVQRLLMLHLQQLALRNNLQVLVTTHSQAVLESVPSFGRIFLRRTDQGNVQLQPPYQDVIQRALYGSATNIIMNVLCEDQTAEEILTGIVDYIAFEEKIDRGAIRIGRDTGADEFPTHVKAFRKFGMLYSFVFVLDGDQKDRPVASKMLEAADSPINIMYLPGDGSPEEWIWKCLEGKSQEFADSLRVNPDELMHQIQRINAIYSGASDSISSIFKAKIDGLKDALHQQGLCRDVAYLEASRPDSGLRPIMEELRGIVMAERL